MSKYIPVCDFGPNAGSKKGCLLNLVNSGQLSAYILVLNPNRLDLIVLYIWLKYNEFYFHVAMPQKSNPVILCVLRAGHAQSAISGKLHVKSGRRFWNHNSPKTFHSDLLHFLKISQHHELCTFHSGGKLKFLNHTKSQKNC